SIRSSCRCRGTSPAIASRPCWNWPTAARSSLEMSETRTLRDRQADTRAAALRLLPFAEGGAVAILAQTRVAVSYPTVPAAFYACTPLQVDGPETEGAAVTYSGDSSRTILAFNLGTQVPPSGTRIIAHACGGRWVFRYDG